MGQWGSGSIRPRVRLDCSGPTGIFAEFIGLEPKNAFERHPFAAKVSSQIVGEAVPLIDSPRSSRALASSRPNASETPLLAEIAGSESGPSLSYCPTALLPYCPTALLPYCPTASFFPSSLGPVDRPYPATPAFASPVNWLPPP